MQIQFGAGIVRSPDRGEPGGAAPHDVGGDRDRLDVVHRRRAAVQADIRRERRLQPRHALLAFQALQQRGLFAADIGAGAVMDVEVEVIAGSAGVLADQAGLVGLVDRRLQALALADELAAHVDVAGMRPHGEAGDQAALDQKMRVVPHDLAILAGAGLRLVGVHDQVVRPAVRLLGHERPFEAGREAGAAAPAQARSLDLVDDGVAPLVEDRLGVVPCAARLRALEPPIMQAIEISEDAVLVLQHHSRLVVLSSCDLSPIGGCGTAASRTLAASPGRFADSSSSGACVPRAVPPLV